MDRWLKIAILSDLHYCQHEEVGACRPALAMAGDHADPMLALIKNVNSAAGPAVGLEGITADYVLCPGDITDKAGEEPFKCGWEKLKGLKAILGAKHLISTTGNHEVDSRPTDYADQMGNVEVQLDPLKILQMTKDYPSTALSDNDRRWVYWGRGYEFIEEDEVLFLIINSSHFHGTTRPVEFERGKLGETALEELREEIHQRVSRNKRRAFIVLLHHHPVPHEDLSVELGRIDMVNGAKLVQLLEETGVVWLIVHGHKHHARLINAQGSSTRPVVFSAGSFGARLDGELAMQTRTQFYLLEILVSDQSITPQAEGRITSWSWNGTEWISSCRIEHGLPSFCGFKVPSVNLQDVVGKLRNLFAGEAPVPFLSWDEVTTEIPELKSLMPGDIKSLRRVLDNAGFGTTWDERTWLPKDISYESS